jgi:uncharacterized protein (UPF0548 family)
MQLVRPNHPIEMERLVQSLQAAPPTYADVGGTLIGARPEGFHHDRYDVPFGRGTDVFQRAVDGLRMWKAHAVPGIRVFPKEETVRTGATVVVTIGTPYLALAAPCRVVGVVDERTRWGFAYGTLPGHPEEGEEAFVVSIAPDQSVHFEIMAFSRPGHHLVRLSGPLGRSMQRVGAHGYLRALRRDVQT